MFLNWPGLGRTGFFFLIVLSLKLLNFLNFIYFFYKIPFQFPLLPLQYRSRSPSGGVGVGLGVGDWSEKVQDVGEGSGFEHHENPAVAADGLTG